MSPQNAYGNIPVFSPEGILMFNTNERRLHFYKKHNLVEIYQNGFRLKFKPNGLGYHGKPGEILLTFPRQNKCVVSGSENIYELTRHHIVPVLFRKWMPFELKSTNYQLIVFLKRDIHARYTLYEQDYYAEIGKMYGVNNYKETLIQHATNISRKKQLANTLLKYSHLIPQNRLDIMKVRFKYYCNIEPTFENYSLVCEEIKESDKRYYKNADYNFGKLVIEKVTDFKEFEKIWLNHFIEMMRPKFLPEDLNIYLG